MRIEDSMVIVIMFLSMLLFRGINFSKGEKKQHNLKLQLPTVATNNINLSSNLT